jgi:hypothetical protein
MSVHRAPGRQVARRSPWDSATTVENDGSTTLKWRGKDAAAHAVTAFGIGRKLARESACTLAGSIGEKTFNDQGVPPGITRVSYRVRARRGNKVSDYSEQPVTVHFGVAPEEGEKSCRSRRSMWRG